MRRHAGRFHALARGWDEIVGEAIAARTRIHSFREGVLIVAVDTPVLLHELNGFMKQQILARLREGEGSRDVAELAFVLRPPAQESR